MKTLYFDTETTGLIANSSVPLDKQPRIIEFCGILVDDATGKILDEVDTLIDPGTKISEEIERITGIKADDLEDKPMFMEVSSKIIAIFQKADQIVAHNLSFDWAMLVNEFRRLGLDFVVNPKKTCTVEGTMHLLGHRLSLQALHQHLFNEGFVGAHRAKTDVKALIRCHRQLVEAGEI